MIIGSGMLARAFSDFAEADKTLCVYAYGVSDSRCSDSLAFSRETEALTHALDRHPDAIFIYFGTCSVDDPEMKETPYVSHKLRMEALVQMSARSRLIIRLPQVVGVTRNQATLLSFLAHHIRSSSPFDLWLNARRNIIDVDDVVSIVKTMIKDRDILNETVNVANTVSYTMPAIVASMEKVLGLKALFRAVSRGAGYPIDISRTLPFVATAGIQFGEEYLDGVIQKYYGMPNSRFIPD